MDNQEHVTMDELISQAHPFALGLCVALLAFFAAMLLADLTDWLFDLSETEEDKTDAD
jgi:hypothetical protein